MRSTDRLIMSNSRNEGEVVLRIDMRTMFGLTSAVLVTIASCDAFACTPPPPPPPWMSAQQIEAEWNQRILDSQISDWDVAASVFIARVESKGTVVLGNESRGRRAVLAPILRIRGPDVGRKIRIQHTGSLCGMQPNLDALDQNASGYFMVYSLDETPTASSIYVTTPLGELVDPNVLAAWGSAYDNFSRQ